MDLKKLALAKCPILITGPTGIGKSRLAEEIHAMHRADKPFLDVDVSALHETTFDSQLFGHRRGSFTGAVGDQVGLCRAVRGGTLFLDEIGDLSLHLQKKLLMLMEKRSFLPIGAHSRLPFEGHFILATNRNLEYLVRLKKFREDLYYRIQVIHIEMESLASRRDDIPKVIGRIISELTEKYGGKSLLLSEELENFFMDYPWPGNIREMKNVLEYLFVFGENEAEIKISDLPDSMLSWMRGRDERGGGEVARKSLWGSRGSLEIDIDKGFQEAIEDFERNYFSEILEKNCGRINKTSREMGISKSTLIAKMKKYKIDASLLREREAMDYR